MDCYLLLSAWVVCTPSSVYCRIIYVICILYRLYTRFEYFFRNWNWKPQMRATSCFIWCPEHVAFLFFRNEPWEEEKISSPLITTSARSWMPIIPLSSEQSIRQTSTYYPALPNNLIPDLASPATAPSHKQLSRNPPDTSGTLTFVLPLHQSAECMRAWRSTRVLNG